MANWPPDWRDPAAYPDPDTTTATRWAWEFLRRNPDYQDDARWVHSLGERAEETGGDEPGSEFLDEREADPPARPGETERAYLERVGGGRVFPLAVAVANSWGMERCPPLPEQPDADEGRSVVYLMARFRLAGGSMLCPPTRQTDMQLSLDRWQRAIVFDLEQPITPQLERADRQLREEQHNRIQSNRIEPYEPPKQYTRHWRDYLRILDARAEGVSQQAIGIALYPERDYASARDMVRKRERRARELRDHEYLVIAMGGV
jgi:hypothetical protein